MSVVRPASDTARGCQERTRMAAVGCKAIDTWSLREIFFILMP
jgi:hypothetical protein